MKKVRYRNNNNNYNNQIYSINYKFDSVSPAGKASGTALELIKKYNELAKEAQANGNYVEAEVFRQYAEHYRKIVTDINERKNVRFNGKDNSCVQPVEENAENSEGKSEPAGSEEDKNQIPEQSEQVRENALVETKAKSAKKTFKVIEVSDKEQKVKHTARPRAKKAQTSTAVNE